MVTLSRNSGGSYRARKRLPKDAREEYGRLYGPSVEAKFSAPAGTTAHAAKQLFGEWLAEVEGQIVAIQAKAKGEGVPLTPRQARALAGEWYGWFINRHPDSDLPKWEALRDQVHDALREAVGDDQWERSNPDELWREDEELRKAVRPVLADAGETAQFLGMKGMALTTDAQASFLDHLYEDLSAALRRLTRLAQGDYSADKYEERFPKFDGADSGVSPWDLFETWRAKRQPAAGTVENWRGMFKTMQAHFGEARSAASITTAEADAWVQSLITTQRAARTVATTWLKAASAVFAWAVDDKRLERNPFAEVKITLPKHKRLRDTKSLLPEEQRTILQAALAVDDTHSPDEAARRWVPWLLAYTGARPAEIAQLRAKDVIERDGVHGLRLTPEAGTIKSGQARVVPLHVHIIEQGFLDFVRRHAPEKPLFYRMRKGGSESGKHPAAQCRQRLAAWVRALGVTDPGVMPNHGWRHLFKQIGRRAKIDPAVLDVICGHAAASVGDSYGKASLEDMAFALESFPRFKV